MAPVAYFMHTSGLSIQHALLFLIPQAIVSVPTQCIAARHRMLPVCFTCALSCDPCRRIEYSSCVIVIHSSGHSFKSNIAHCSASRHATSVLDVRAVKLPVDTGAVGSPLREKRTVCSVKFTLLELELWAL